MNSTKILDLHGIIDLAVKNIPDFTIKPLLINGVVVYTVSGQMVDTNMRWHDRKTHAQDLGVACGNLLSNMSPLLDFDFDVLYEGQCGKKVFKLNQNTFSDVLFTPNKIPTNPNG